MASFTRTMIAPIPGATKLHRLEENLGAAALVLTTKGLAQIEHAMSKLKLEEAWLRKAMEQMTEH